MTTRVDPAGEIQSALAAVLLRAQLLRRTVEGRGAVAPAELLGSVSEIEGQVRRIRDLVDKLDRDRAVAIPDEFAREIWH